MAEPIREENAIRSPLILSNIYYFFLFLILFFLSISFSLSFSLSGIVKTWWINKKICHIQTVIREFLVKLI